MMACKYYKSTVVAVKEMYTTVRNGGQKGGKVNGV